MGGRRAAFYLRVSSEDQTYENQRPDLDRIIATRGLELVAAYEETASAVKRRPAFDRMMEDAHRGAFDVLVVWSLDRFGRSMAGNVSAVLALDARGVVVVSARESWLDAGGPTRSLLLAIFSWIAEQERAQIVARTKAGMDRARNKGIQVGRPRARVDVRAARELLAGGASKRQCAVSLGVPFATLDRALKRA